MHLFEFSDFCVTLAWGSQLYKCTLNFYLVTGRDVDNGKTAKK